MSGGVTPPSARTHLGRRLSAAAREGTLELPRCTECGTVQYPPREICRSCLGIHLAWEEIEGAGEVLASVELHNSLEPWFQDHLPWPIASIRLACGATVLAHIAPTATRPGTEVCVRNILDSSGESTLYAVPGGDRDLDQSELDAFLKKYRAEA